MANVTEESWSSLQQIEKELQTYLGSKTTSLPEHIAQLLVSFRSAGQDIILQDFELAKRKGVENRLWDVHGKINSRYRKQLRQLRDAGGQRKAVEQRKIEKHLLDFIKSSQRFYRGYIQSLGSRFEGVRELEAVANKLTLSTLSVEKPAPATGDLERLLLVSCHQSLIRLGDLSRWRETQLETKSRNWGPAIGYYDLAGRIYPASGASHNQLAVIALQDMNHLGAVYHLYLALAVEEPHPNAKDNLEVEFRKIEEAWSKGEVLMRENAMDSQGATKDLTASYVRLHARYYKGEEFPEHEDLEGQTLNQLAVNLKERSMESTLSKMVLVNIAAEHFAVHRLRNDHDSLDAMQSFFSLQRLNVRTVSTLLQILQAELERYIGEETSETIGSHKVGPARISVVARRVLPALRHYSSWLMANANILVANNSNDALNDQVKDLWKTYANTLTLLASVFPVVELEAVRLNYLLDEDEITLGFSPFKHRTISRRYCMEDGISQKPRYHDGDSSVQRHHPAKEMLGRVRDILIDGIMMIQQHEIPLALVDNNTTFKFSGDDSLNESGCESRLQSTNTHVEDVTYIEETSFSQSVSIAASLSNPMDIDTQRMVDNLVDSEFGGEQDAVDNIIKRVTQSVRSEGDDTSYGLIGSATVLEHFGQDPIGGRRRCSRPLLPSIENSPFAPLPDEEPLLASPCSPISQKTPAHSRHASQNAPLLQQQPRYIGILSSNSSMPTPTFQNTNPDRFSANAGNQHPSVHARNVQKALDDSHFRSSAIFSGSTFGYTQHG